MNSWLLACSESRGTQGRAGQRLIQAWPKPEVADQARTRAGLVTSSNTGWVGRQRKSTLGTTRGVDVRRERGMAMPLSLVAVRPAQNEAGGSQEAGGTARYACTVCQSVLSTDLCWTNLSYVQYHLILVLRSTS
jgi:hypothetical protein